MKPSRRLLPAITRTEMQELISRLGAGPGRGHKKDGDS